MRYKKKEAPRLALPVGQRPQITNFEPRFLQPVVGVLKPAIAAGEI